MKQDYCEVNGNSVVVRTYVHSGPGGPLTRNVQMSGRPVKYQRSLKSPSLFLTSEWKNCSYSYGQRIEYETKCPLVPSGRTKLQLTDSFGIITVIRFSFLLPLSAPGPNGQRIEYVQHTNVTGSMNWHNNVEPPM